MRGLTLLVCALGACSTPDPFFITARFNRTWETATTPYSGRYAGLDRYETHRVRHKELRFFQLLDALTAVDGCGEDHGCYHLQKDDRDEELWNLLEQLPAYPGEAQLLMAAIDNVYLGYHWNGWWGYDWHWPYFNCVKAVTLADRLAKNHPAFEEEATWTLIYCHRVRPMNQSSDTPAGKAQKDWSGSLERARALCNELVTTHPNGKHVAHAKRLLEMTDDDLGVRLNHVPSLGSRPYAQNEEWCRRALGFFSREGP